MFKSLIRNIAAICLAVSLFVSYPVAVLLAAQDSAAGDKAASTADAGKQEEESTEPPQRRIQDLEPGQWEPLFELGESIYPSVVISTATFKTGLWDDKQHIGDRWGVIGIVVRGTEDNCPIKVEMSGSGFIKPSEFTGTLESKDTVYCVYPDLKYDYEKLLAVKQTVPEMISFKVTIAGKAEPEKTVRVQVRPINECVFNFQDSSGNINDVSFFFAAYVNENHPFISQIMKEAMVAGKVSAFTGYSDDAESVMSEIDAIWQTLKRRGMRYSTMPASADDDDPYLSSQYVRLLGESVNYSQANCVDGSVLMASVFRKMGLDASLVEFPDHMLVAVNLDSDGKETAFIETTALSDSTLDEAMASGYEQYSENRDKFDSKKDEDQAYNIVNVQNARVMGIMPIKDVSAK